MNVEPQRDLTADEPRRTHMTDETLRHLISQKATFINSIVGISMQWWISSIAFSAAVLWAVWTSRDELMKRPWFVHGLGVVLFVFFFVIAYFGFMVSRRLGKVQSETADLAADLKHEPKKFFLTEVRTFQHSMHLGANSFALMHLIWVEFWLHLARVESMWPYVACAVVGVAWWSAVWLYSRRKENEHHEEAETSRAAGSPAGVAGAGADALGEGGARPLAAGAAARPEKPTR